MTRQVAARTEAMVRFAACYRPKCLPNQGLQRFEEGTLLAHLSGPVKIVLPDLSLVTVQAEFDANLNLQEYARPDYLPSQIDGVKDPHFKYLLAMTRNMRNTSYDEASVGMDIQRVLDVNSVSNHSSFAREITIRDVSEGNSILIGSYRSNPLAALFKDQLNYRLEEDPVTKDCFFSNQHPAPGEPSHYFVYTMDKSRWIGDNATWTAMPMSRWCPT